MSLESHRPFHSALEYLVSLSQAATSRRTVRGRCAQPESCPAVDEAADILEIHRRREQLSLLSESPHERGPFGLADRCGFHVLEVRILAYLFLSEGTAPSVPVFLDSHELVRLIADESEAGEMLGFLEDQEALVASGCMLRIRVGERWMLALSETGRDALVSGDLPGSARNRRNREQMWLPFARGQRIPQRHHSQLE